MTTQVTEDIEAPVLEVWAIVSDFANLKRWHPAVVSTETRGSGAGAIRTVHFPDWWAEERLDAIDHTAYRLDYSITDSTKAEMVGLRGTITLEPISKLRTRISWVSGLEAGNPHREMLDAALGQYYPVRIEHLRAVLGLLPWE